MGVNTKMVDERCRVLTTDEVKDIELKLLIEFDRLCKENGLYYVLCGGTLLGAVRHKGFIPWDDDIDVLMPRKYYDRLLNVKNIDLSSLPEYVELASWKSGSTDYPFIKLIDKRTVIDSKYNDDRKTNHLWIDIFPIDGNPESDIELKKLYRKSKFYRRILLLKMARLGQGKSFIKRAMKPALKLLFLPVSIKWICKRIDALAKTYDVESSKYLGGVVWGYGTCERIDKESFLHPVSIEFEGHFFNAPSNYDEYLTNLYGDYLKMPPVEKRVTHEMMAYFISSESI